MHSRLFVLFLVIGATRAASPIEVPVEHAFGNGDFTPAGVLKGKISNKGGVLGPLVFQRNGLTEQQEALIRSLVKANGYYRLRVPSVPTDPDSPHVMASLHVRCLAAGSFHEALKLDLTEDNRIVALDYQTKEGACNPTAEVQIQSDTELFSADVTVLFNYPLAAPYISMEEFLASVEDDELGAPSGKPGEKQKKTKTEKTWLQQNWMFLLAGAVIILQVMGNLAEDDGGQGRGGGGGRAPARR